MSKFKSVLEASAKPVSKDRAMDAVTSISTNLEYLYKLFYSSGGGNNFQALNRFNMYKADMERRLAEIQTYLSKAK